MQEEMDFWGSIFTTLKMNTVRLIFKDAIHSRITILTILIIPKKICQIFFIPMIGFIMMVTIILVTGLKLRINR